MATSKTYFPRQNYRFLSTDHYPSPLTHDSFELDESDIYPIATHSDPPEFRKPALSSRLSKKSNSVKDRAEAAAPSSLPVNIPDWSKILKEDYRRQRSSDAECYDHGDYDDDEVDGEDRFDRGMRVPPHEFLARQMARTRIASFSVHEGIGRTLKGRDLSRVRNAIWEKTGFQD